MTDHPDFSPEMSTFYEQDTLPRRVAKKLTYEAGFALGVEASSDTDNGRWLGPLLLDARVLTRRHSSYAAAGRLMHVAEAGVRGLLWGAGYVVDLRHLNTDTAAVMRPFLEEAGWTVEVGKADEKLNPQSEVKTEEANPRLEEAA
jgi:hypothetical protein